MSNQSDTTPYRRYFGGVIQKMGVLPVITEYGPKLYLDADVPFSPQGKNARARVRITLRLSTDKSYWVVSEFTVTSANPFWILWGSDFLEHYGKRPGNKEGDLPLVNPFSNSLGKTYQKTKSHQICRFRLPPNLNNPQTNSLSSFVSGISPNFYSPIPHQY